MTITKRVHSSSPVSLSHWWASSGTRWKSVGAAVHLGKANELEDERQTQRRFRKDQGKKGTVCKKPYMCIYNDTVRQENKCTAVCSIRTSGERRGEGKRTKQADSFNQILYADKKGGGDWGKTSAQPQSLIIHSTTFTPFLKINCPHADLGWALTFVEY